MYTSVSEQAERVGSGICGLWSEGWGDAGSSCMGEGGCKHKAVAGVYIYMIETKGWFVKYLI